LLDYDGFSTPGSQGMAEIHLKESTHKNPPHHKMGKQKPKSGDSCSSLKIKKKKKKSNLKNRKENHWNWK